MSLFDRRPRLRWAVPVAAGALVIAGTFVGSVAASADAGLPPKTPQELLVAVQSPQATAISGTVVSQADLGLPELPMRTAGSEMSSLISGTHTLRVWSDGPQRSRVALIGNAAEADVIRNGQDVWMWSSDANTVDHLVMPPKDPAKAGAELPPGVTLPSTPQEAASMALASIDETTNVTTTGVSKVAGRPVYELVLTPKQSDTLVARVAIAVDAETNAPLRVQVFSTQLQDPAFEVGFTDVDFSTPDASVFAFTPPPGAIVTEHSAGDHAGKPADAPASADGVRPTVVGSGWTQVMVAKVPPTLGDPTRGAAFGGRHRSGARTAGGAADHHGSVGFRPRRQRHAVHGDPH